MRSFIQNAELLRPKSAFQAPPGTSLNVSGPLSARTWSKVSFPVLSSAQLAYSFKLSVLDPALAKSSSPAKLGLLASTRKTSRQLKIPRWAAQIALRKDLLSPPSNVHAQTQRGVSMCCGRIIGMPIWLKPWTTAGSVDWICTIS